ncbi:hypothetical protein [Klebsiella aerogenes]|uniref:hypothetical protein n=1 Tax=Klebsiella aerogenes TaxID=548 RepID=UPI002FEF2630|nr:hypothetical protein [Klebsiella aerogenes]
MVNEIDAVVTRVIDYWPISGLWMVEVEVMADGQYLRRDISATTKREALAIRPGDTVLIPFSHLDSDFDDEDELPF